MVQCPVIGCEDDSNDLSWQTRVESYLCARRTEGCRVCLHILVVPALPCWRLHTKRCDSSPSVQVLWDIQGRLNSLPAGQLCAVCLKACAVRVHREEEENQVGDFCDLRDTKCIRERCVTQKPLGGFRVVSILTSSLKIVP